MALTKDQITDILANRLAGKIIKELLWADFTTAMVDTSAAERTNIVQAARQNDNCLIGKHVNAAIKKLVDSKALAEATAMLEDDALDLEELERTI